MTTSRVRWTDQAGTTHQLRRARELSIRERKCVAILRQQTVHTALLLKAGYGSPTIRQAALNMMRMMFLLPHVAEQEIAAFDTTTGNDLLTQWWAIADAAA
jgi:hypothetical protein